MFLSGMSDEKLEARRQAMVDRLEGLLEDTDRACVSTNDEDARDDLLYLTYIEDEIRKRAESITPK